MVDPGEFPAWLKPNELDYYVGEFEQSGFFGPISRYRNHERDFAWLQQFKGRKLDQPSLLIGGDKDPATVGGRAVRDLDARLRRMGFSEVTACIYPGTRHESLNEINRDQISNDFVDWLEQQAL